MKNVYKGWRTTFIGIAMIGAGIASVMTGKSDWTGAIVAISMGVGFLFTPDDIIKKQKNG